MSREDLEDDIGDYKAMGDEMYSVSLQTFANQLDNMTCEADREECVKAQELLNADFPQYRKVNVL